MKRSIVGDKILLGLYDFFSATEIVFSRDSLWNKLQRLGGAPSRGDFIRSFNSLQRTGFWRLTANGRYKLTKKGIEKLEKIQLREFIRKQKWDGWWRVVIFDITENKRPARDALRRKLRDFGFYPLQRSVFIFPFDCQKEIMDLASFFDEEDNIEYIMAKTLGKKEEEIKGFFGLG